MSQRYLRIPGRRTIITKKMVEDAVDNTLSNMEAARWLGVSYNTYKKWSKYYDLFEQHLNPSGVGVPKSQINSTYNLDDILAGKYPDYPIKQLKLRIIKGGYLPEECDLCGWNEERLTDEKVCLTMDFIDGDSKNLKHENLRFLCANCYFTNVGNFKSSRIFC